MNLLNVEQVTSFFSPSLTDSLGFEEMKQVIYSLDMNERYPAIRSRYIDEQNIRAVKCELANYFYRRFQELVGKDWYWFDERRQKFSIPSSLTRNQQKIQGLFSLMFELVSGADGIAEGARFNFLTTNYDWLVEAVADSTCGDDDSALLYLYRGITPSEIAGFTTPVIAHEHWLVFNHLKINGGFEVIFDRTDFRFDYRQRTLEDSISHPPTLIFPSREQDYRSKYFDAIFPKAVSDLAHVSWARVQLI